MKKRSSVLILFVLLCLMSVSSFAQAAKPAVDKALISKTEQLLKSSGHVFGQITDNAWSVRFRGNTLDDIAVTTIVSREGLLVLSVVVAEKKEFRATPELMSKLLRLNNDYDRLKIGIKDNGNLFVRIDMSLRVTDAEEFKLNVEQVSAAADEIATAIKPYLVTTPARKTGK
ncbi:MAG: hypothetical protein JST85_05485 [Acidobacteria bacterium]|nr:hypothetical protein [Acidobacteriota bacterium]